MPELPGFKKLVKFTISMMMNVKSIAKCEVYLFSSDNLEYTSNPLKQFVYYLRYQGKRGQINFSLSCGTDSLHLGLTIGENFTLDSISKSLVHKSEEHLSKKLLKIENEYTVKLLKMLPGMDTKLEDLSKESLALVSIVKSLLARSEYLFLVDTEKNLSEETYETVKLAMQKEAEHFGRKILIKSYSPQSWVDFATNIIEKSPQGEFINKENPLCKLTRHSKDNNPYHFTLLKKAV